jgi:hypothetical protein
MFARLEGSALYSHLHYRIISLREEVRSYTINLGPPRLINLHLLSFFSTLMKHALQCPYVIAYFFNSMQCKIRKRDKHVASHATQSCFKYTTMGLLWHSLDKLSLVGQELLILSEHMRSLPVFSYSIFCFMLSDAVSHFRFTTTTCYVLGHRWCF